MELTYATEEILHCAGIEGGSIMAWLMLLCICWLKFDMSSCESNMAWLMFSISLCKSGMSSSDVIGEYVGATTVSEIDEAIDTSSSAVSVLQKPLSIHLPSPTPTNR